MKKLSLFPKSIVSAGLALLFCSAFALEPHEVRKKVYKSIHPIYVYNRTDKKVFYGSGVAVTKNIIATNCHVALSANEILIIVKKKKYVAHNYRINKEHDLCLLIIEKNILTPVKIRLFSNIQEGEKVYAIGYPENINIFISGGIVSNKTTHKNKKWLLTDTTISSGSSGGGLFDSEGNLIGITSSTSKLQPNITLSAAADWIATTLSLPSVKRFIKKPQPKKEDGFIKLGVFGDNKITVYKKDNFCFIYFPGRNADGVLKGAAIWSYKYKNMLMVFPQSSSVSTVFNTVKNEFSSSRSNPKLFYTKHYIYLDKKWFNLHTLRHPENTNLLILYFKENPSHFFINKNRFVIHIKHPRNYKKYNTLTFGLWGFTDAYMAYRKHCKK